MEKIKRRRTASLMILVTMIIFLFFGGYSFAKYTENVVINSKTQIAEPIFEIENGPAIDITETQTIGEYNFKIKNFNSSDKLNQVDLNYCINILSKTDNSIEMKLYENDNEISLNDNKSEYIKLSKDKKEERNYIIKIAYDKNSEVNAEDISDIAQSVQVEVHTEQIGGALK